jgi:hypothetical protein
MTPRNYCACAQTEAAIVATGHRQEIGEICHCCRHDDRAVSAADLNNEMAKSNLWCANLPIRRLFTNFVRKVGPLRVSNSPPWTVIWLHEIPCSRSISRKYNLLFAKHTGLTNSMEYSTASEAHVTLEVTQSQSFM